MLSEQSDGPRVTRCPVCEGTGLINTEIGGSASNDQAHRADVDQCATCDGYGQLTDCPLCAGAGCWDCDDGSVAGP